MEVKLSKQFSMEDTAHNTLAFTLSAAEISGLNEITATLGAKTELDPTPMYDIQNSIQNDVQNTVTVTDGQGGVVEILDISIEGAAVIITTASALDVAAAYTVTAAIDGFDNLSLDNSVTAVAGSVVRTDAFDEKYAYDGDDLGFSYSEESTIFKIWAPTALAVTLNIYESVMPNSGLSQSYAMLGGAAVDRGVWSCTIDGDLKDTAYDFTLEFASGVVNRSVDPYARAAVANGGRSVVLSDEQITPKNWSDERVKGRIFSTKDVISEIHVRDFSIHPSSGISEVNRGKYLGVVESGATNSSGNPTGIDHLKKLGVTYAQIMPVYDFGSVDETTSATDNNYNWGYDPVNYNVPEGSYSSDATDPKARIIEIKQMIHGIHANGLRIIMDVVYNHVYDADSHSFNLTVPGYYFRYTSSGAYANGSGCGNDVASERAMARKYIVDSVVYWAKTYNIDGFRFDLMGNLDIKTMKAVRRALSEIDPNITILGEGWNLGTTLDDSEKAIQMNATQLEGISFFNDSLRDAVKGSVFDDADTGFATGKAGLEALIATNMLGGITRTDSFGNLLTCNGDYAAASQMVQYVEAHDNLTLYDKLLKSAPRDNAVTIEQRVKLATAMILLSQGMPMMQIGQEFLRTKNGNSNSYNAGDSVNAINWDRIAEYSECVNYVRGLIALRKTVTAFHMSNYSNIAAHTSVLAEADGLVAIQLTDDSGTYIIAFNGSSSVQTVSGLISGTYTVISSDGHVDMNAVNAIAGESPAESAVLATIRVGQEGTYSLAPLEAVVLKQGIIEV